MLPQRRHAREHRDRLRAQVSDELRGEGGALHHQRGAAARGAQHLAHAVHEAERQHARDPVRADDAQVVDHRLRRREQIGVRDGHSARESRRARRVDDLGRIGADARHGVERRPVGHVVNLQDPTLRLERSRLAGEQVPGCEQGRCSRSLQDVLDLAGTQRLVDDDRDPPGRRHAEERRDRVGPAVEEDPHPVVGAQPRVQEGRGDGSGASLEGRIVSGLPALDDRGMTGGGVSRPPQQTGDVGGQSRLRALNSSRCRITCATWIRGMQ